MNFNVIGAGLAGVEAAWQIAESGCNVTLWEQKPLKKSPAHKSDNFAELVCSNSLKAERLNSAAGLLKEEMVRLGSLTVPIARECAVAAGGALAVDRDLFSKAVTEKIKNHKNITVKTAEMQSIPKGENEITIVATGPLTDGATSKAVQELCGGCLSFYDAAAPIVTFDSLDKEKVFFASTLSKYLLYLTLTLKFLSQLGQ